MDPLILFLLRAYDSSQLNAEQTSVCVYVTGLLAAGNTLNVTLHTTVSSFFVMLEIALLPVLITFHLQTAGTPGTRLNCVLRAAEACVSELLVLQYF
jgi:hypothetical protein